MMRSVFDRIWDFAGRRIRVQALACPINTRLTVPINVLSQKLYHNSRILSIPFRKLFSAIYYSYLKNSQKCCIMLLERTKKL